MGVAAGVHQESIQAARRLLDPVDQFAFDVRLEEEGADAKLDGVLGNVAVDGFQVFLAVRLRLAGPQQVEVGAVNDADR